MYLKVYGRWSDEHNIERDIHINMNEIYAFEEGRFNVSVFLGPRVFVLNEESGKLFLRAYNSKYIINFMEIDTTHLP